MIRRNPSFILERENNKIKSKTESTKKYCKYKGQKVNFKLGPKDKDMKDINKQF